MGRTKVGEDTRLTSCKEILHYDEIIDLMLEIEAMEHQRFTNDQIEKIEQVQTYNTL